jgi:subtilisin family serine protease
VHKTFVYYCYMRSVRYLAVLPLVLGLSTAASTSGVTAAPPSGDYLITVRSAQDVDAGVAAARSAGASVRYVYRHAITGFAASLPSSAVSALSRNPKVTLIEPDGLVTSSKQDNGSQGVNNASVGTTATTTTTTTIQNSATWGLDRIDQRDLPLNSQYTYTATGATVQAYIVDTGVRTTHIDFGGRVQGGYTAINDGRGTDDCDGHGTHVAGTVAGTTWGVAKGAAIIPVRVLDCNGSGTTSGVVAGLDWIAANHTPGTAGVANMSLGGGASSTLDSAVRRVVNKGVTVVVAAGNSGLDACNYSPARVAEAITVGATDSTDARTSWSNFGTCVDIFAPGASITSAYHTSDTATARLSGTSMAAPHVAGVAALMLQSSPTASPTEVSSTMLANATPNKVTSAGTGSPNLLLYSLGDGPTVADPVTPVISSITVTHGGGRWVNATAVVQAVTDEDPSTAASGLNVTGNWTLDGAFVATQNGVTSSNGQVSFSVSVRSRTGTLNFCVTGVGGTGYDTTASNVPVCPADLVTPPDDGGSGDPEPPPATEPPADENPPPSEDPVPDTWGLEATAFKDKGWQYVRLTWTATGTVSVFRDGTKLTEETSSSTYLDDLRVKGGGSYVYKICSTTDTSSCSAEIRVSF